MSPTASLMPMLCEVSTSTATPVRAASARVSRSTGCSMNTATTAMASTRSHPNVRSERGVSASRLRR